MSEVYESLQQRIEDFVKRNDHFADKYGDLVARLQERWEARVSWSHVSNLKVFCKATGLNYGEFLRTVILDLDGSGWLTPKALSENGSEDQAYLLMEYLYRSDTANMYVHWVLFPETDEWGLELPTGEQDSGNLGL